MNAADLSGMAAEWLAIVVSIVLARFKKNKHGEFWNLFFLPAHAERQGASPSLLAEVERLQGDVA